MRKFFRSYTQAIRLPIVPIAWGLLSVLGIAGGAFGTSGLNLPGRLIMWPVLIAAGVMIGTALRVLVRDYMGFRRFLPEAPLVALLSAAAVAPLFQILAIVLGAPMLIMPSLPELVINIFIVSMVFSTFRHLMGGQFAPALTGSAPAPAEPVRCEHCSGAVRPADAEAEIEAAQEAEAERGAAARLLGRLPPARRGALIRLEVNDHYVKVVTESGSENLLMRLADAISETEGVDGLQVHRSHWVARDAITGLARERGKCVLVLQDGSQVPVSRSHAPRVQALALPAFQTKTDGA